LLVESNVAFGGIVAARAIVKSFNRTTVRILRREIETRGKHLLHEKAGGDGLQGIVHGLGDGLCGRVRLSDQISEAGASFSRRVTSRAADDLHDLSETRSVANRQGMLTPNPVEAFLGHAEGDDDVYMVAVVLLRRIFQRS